MPKTSYSHVTVLEVRSPRALTPRVRYELCRVVEAHVPQEGVEVRSVSSRIEPDHSNEKDKIR